MVHIPADDAEYLVFNGSNSAAIARFARGPVSTVSGLLSVRLGGDDGEEALLAPGWALVHRSDGSEGVWSAREVARVQGLAA